MLQRFCIPLLIIASLTIIQACGSGGGSDSAENTSQPLLVNAGPSIESDEQQSVNLLGAGSGGEGQITFAWSSSDGLSIEHPDNTVSNASLITPLVTQTQIFILTLTVTDQDGKQATDTLNLTVNPLNGAPVANIQASQIDDFEPLHYPILSTIQLDGSNSTDPDPVEGLAPIATFLWQQIAGPDLIAGIDLTQASIELTTPVLNEEQQAVFRLTVTDQEQESNSTDITLTLLAQKDTQPTIEVDSIHDVMSGELIAVKANAQSIAPAAHPFIYSWTNNGFAIFNDSGSFQTTAVAPVVNTTTTINYIAQAEDSFRNRVTGQQPAQVFPIWVKRLNDTGVSVFANGSGLASEYSHTYPGQDAAYGADRMVISGALSKFGEGQQGFDFTRLDNSGNEVSNPSFAFSCVRDNVTGLVWQVKSNADAQDINYVHQEFTWFSEEENGNVEGVLNEMSPSCNVANGQCNTQDYVAEISNKGLCGFFDWRLPSLEELQSIVHFGGASKPLVDQVFFPYLGPINTDELWYWTSQSSADGVSEDLANNAWALDFNSGKDGFFNKSTQHYVILVRAGN